MDLILILGIPMVLIILGLILIYTDHDSGIIPSLLGGTILIAAILLLPIRYYNVKAEISEFLSVQETMNQCRSNNISVIERAAIQIRVIDMNKWLAKNQYWNESIFDIYIPDEVMKLEPIK